MRKLIQSPHITTSSNRSTIMIGTSMAFLSTPVFNRVRLARNLLIRLLQPNPIDRYSVAKALQHPWITRSPSDKIPRTMKEVMNGLESEAILKSVSLLLTSQHFQAIFFLSLVKNDSSRSLSTSESQCVPEYSELLSRIS